MRGAIRARFAPEYSARYPPCQHKQRAKSQCAARVGESVIGRVLCERQHRFEHRTGAKKNHDGKNQMNDSHDTVSMKLPGVIVDASPSVSIACARARHARTPLPVKRFACCAIVSRSFLIRRLCTTRRKTVTMERKVTLLYCM